MAGAKDGWYELKKDIRAELNEGLLGQFHWYAEPAVRGR